MLLDELRGNKNIKENKKDVYYVKFDTPLLVMINVFSLYFILYDVCFCINQP